MKRPLQIVLTMLFSAAGAAALWIHFVPQTSDVQTSQTPVASPDPAVPNSSVAPAPVTTARSTAEAASFTRPGFGYGAVSPKPPAEYVTISRDVRIPHGTATTRIPKGTKVLVVSRGADVVQVRFGNYSELIPSSAVAPK